MLVMGVAKGDYIMIGEEIKIRVIKTGDIFRIAIDAPKELTILRNKLYERQTGIEDEVYAESAYGERQAQRKAQQQR